MRLLYFEDNFVKPRPWFRVQCNIVPHKVLREVELKAEFWRIM